MKYKIIYPLISLLFFFLCCEKKSEHPVIKSISATPVSGFEVKLKGEISNIGEYKVSDYGFMIMPDLGDNVSNLLNYGQKNSMGSNVSVGSFEKTVEYENSWTYSNKGNFSAYITNTKGTAYSEIVSFTMPQVKITGLSPTNVTIGDTVTIYGENFGTNPSVIRIKLNYSSYYVTITEIVNNYIKFIVPFNPDYSSVYITFGKDYSHEIYCGTIY